MRSVRLATSASAALTTAALALALTACGGDGDGSASPAASSAAGSATGGAATSPSTSSAPAATSSDSSAGVTATPAAEDTSGTSTSGGSGSSGSSASSGDDDCTLDSSSIKLEETGGTIPSILLTLTNTGSKDCAVYNAPFVSDPVAGKNLPVNKDTVPQAVVELAPGHTAYAAIHLSDKPTHRTKALNVTLADPSGGGTDGHVTVTAPASGSGLGLDDSSEVTYWQVSEELALQ
ncbi:DUF4232 domain-containing protein [Streptomyces sp. NPDC008125]|uniref:DUF4232 domain-containing protein n=1 Tax=Streptomyces sp. NPDC008125 TaxID=3364811 RepID=UPI0036EA669F